LEEAAEAGVEVLAFTCRTTPDTLELADPVPVVFQSAEQEFLHRYDRHR
jgi:DNA-binding sugar fermentation-stimulating protein